MNPLLHQPKLKSVKPTSTLSGHHCLLIQAQRVAEEFEGIAFRFVENIVCSKECILKAMKVQQINVRNGHPLAGERGTVY